jgi:hypothetical protein
MTPEEIITLAAKTPFPKDSNFLPVGVTHLGLFDVPGIKCSEAGVIFGGQVLGVTPKGADIIVWMNEGYWISVEDYVNLVFGFDGISD